MRISILTLLIAFIFGSCQRKESAFIGKDLHNGDLIFQTSQSAQSKAIQLATNSKYSHCGIVYKEDGKWFVFEAVQPVQKTPLDAWIARGKNSHYVVKRLKNADKVLTEANLTKMKAAAQERAAKTMTFTLNGATTGYIAQS